jgi:hypothetical protein
VHSRTTARIEPSPVLRRQRLFNQLFDVLKLLYSPFWTTVFLAIGIGAILQVIVEIARLIRRSQERAGEPALTWTTFAGAAVGIALMYLTALLVAA